ncbi:hypothetical protein SK128_017368 [Halocaridina rubra]|uniref:Uncharacterized protein n=1 Tax=Halocaridina rubra TaxID=373956 RepID=A0AAN8XLV8_HALRR
MFADDAKIVKKVKNENNGRELQEDLNNLHEWSEKKYYKHKGQLQLDVGAFANALEFACDIKSEIVGKPSPQFFGAALQDMGITADKRIFTKHEDGYVFKLLVLNILLILDTDCQHNSNASKVQNSII